ncbi:class I SAM-dependent methyltransferase [Streptomyces sp. PTM05]|uniref:Class I SAM-dependent methyltransferase n=1 Tax=Streptantibioticus parmotrematis TaxID=2873249 RepID=A0ABS7QU24_9ACTN|nr:class I SAM-dependent methyltransferase [Streptantibioticus parmotrematis]MBY8886685.1 class I SAM-dependent methyltransferase [Streptantibioticus parmotrematis]
MNEHTGLATSFGAAARTYDRYRPGPPPEAVDWLLPPGCGSVLDLGAGTGLLTRVLAGRVADVVAVDPDSRMREVLAQACPGAVALEGTAEAVPLPDARVDAVLVSAAWHWMDPARALPEIARVLRPGGTLGILWTRRDRSVAWVAELDAYVAGFLGSGDRVGRTIQHMTEHLWLPEGAPFTDVESHAVRWETRVTADELVGMFTTYSGYLTQPPDRREEFAAAIRSRFRALTATDTGTLPLPMACHCWRLRAVTG